MICVHAYLPVPEIDHGSGTADASAMPLKDIDGFRYSFEPRRSSKGGGWYGWSLTSCLYLHIPHFCISEFLLII